MFENVETSDWGEISALKQKAVVSTETSNATTERETVLSPIRKDLA